MSAQPNVSIAPNSQLAIASLVLGILSWILLPVLGAIGAVICGHMARGEIRRSRGSLAGDGLAVGGLVLGYLHLILLLVGLVFVVLFLGGLAAVLASANT